MEIVPQIFWNSLVYGSFYALAAGAMAMQYNLLKVLNFSMGQMMALGAYFLFLFNIMLKLSFTLSIFLMIICMTITALVSLKIFIKPFIRKGAVATFIITIALGIIVENLIQLGFGASLKTYTLTSGAINLGLFYASPVQILVVLAAVITMIIIALIFHSTGIGRKVRAISEGWEQSESVGISTKTMAYVVFTLAIIIAAFAGILIGYETSLTPQMGFAYTVRAFAAMIVGGLGNFWGVLAGAYLIAFIENFGIGISIGDLSIPSGFRDGFAFIIIILALIFRPYGLFARKRRTI
jgi:branched-subunit amino acid ABC-type transport system permease component